MRNFNKLNFYFSKIDLRFTAMNFIIFTIGFVFMNTNTFAQVTVTNPANTTPGLSPTYASFELAINDLNLQTDISGPVIISIDPGNPQTAPAGGYAITANLIGASATNLITLNGGGNSITAFTPQVSGLLNDALIKIIGSDFVTIQNFTLLENAANTTTAAGTNNMTEFGIALFYESVTNGCQNITIFNCTIDLDRTYQNTFGIYANSTHTATNMTTTATATGINGGNNNLVIRRNTITDVNLGIVVVGPTASADHSEGLVVGGNPGLGNTIINFGTTGTFSGYANVSGTVNGILVRNTKGFSISYNSVSSSVGGVTLGTLNGIHIPAFSTAPLGTFTNNINNNNVSLQPSTGTGAINGILMPSTTASASSTLNINSNNFHTFGPTVASTGTIFFISCSSPNQFTTIGSNTFTNISVNTSGSVTFIGHTFSIPSNGSLLIDNNSIVTGFSKTLAGGSVIITTSNSVSATGSINNYTNNNFSNISVIGATVITGFNNTDGGAGSTKTITGNSFNNWTGGSSTINTMNFTYWNGVSTLSGNNISNITGTSTITGITIGSTTNNATSISIENNVINNLTSSGTSGVVTGITCANTSSLININSNTISNLTSSNASAVNGIVITGATNTSLRKNKIYGLSGSNASSTVNGILVSGGTSVTLVNNILGDFTTPNANAANPLVGINITGSTSTSAFYNTVYLNSTSAGALFGSSAISASSTPSVTLRNNIFVNLSTPNGSGNTVAFRRSTTTLTSYQAASNNNLFFAGTPGTNNLIFFDGTNADQTLENYKSRVSPRDAASVSENAPFLSLSGSSSDFLHINPTIPTQIESAGAPIAGIIDDFDGDTRNVSTPDIGADEGVFLFLDLVPPSITFNPLLVTCLTGDRTLSGVTITDLSGIPLAPSPFIPRIYYRKNAGSWFSTSGVLTSGTATNSTWDFTILALDMGGLVVGDLIEYFVIAQDISIPTNVGSNPSTGLVASDVLTISSYPTTPLSYVIGNTIGGSYSVGVGGDFNTLTDAINAYNTSCLTSAVIFNLTDASYTEAGAMTININPDASVVNTLTIKPAIGVTATVSSTVANGAVLKILGSHVVIDGSNNGSTSRDLTISNLSTTAPNVIWIGSSGVSLPITNVMVKNNLLLNGSNASSAIIILDGTSIATAGYFTNVTIENNSILRAYIGIFTFAIVSPGNGGGLVISGNDLNTAGANSIRLVGIYVQGVDGAMITNNNIGNMANSGMESTRGIWLATGTINSTVSGNNISNITMSNTGAFATSGIYIAAGATAVNLNIDNNTVSNLTNSGTNLSFAGIITFTPNTNITNNTVSGLTQITSGASWGIIASGATNCNISGNSVVGMTTTTTGTTSGLNVQGLSTNVNVFNNTVSNIKNFNTTGFGSNGIQLSSSSLSANIKVYNNFVFDIAARGFGGGGVGDNGYGIIVTAGAGYDIDFNTIHLNTNQTSLGRPAAFNVTSGVTTAGAINLRNNIFSNSQTFVDPGRYAIYSGATNTVFGAIDNNVYFSAGPNLGFIGVVRPTISDIQTGFGGNTNSVNVEPIFVSSTDLHLDVAQNIGLSNLGTPIVGITTDIDGDIRNISSPDVGADEWEQPTEVIDWGNLQWPPSGTIFPQNDYNAFGQAYKAGLTESDGQAAGLVAWIGYSTNNGDPSTWSNWIPASFNVQAGNNDEFIGSFPPNTFTDGTYYYTFRYQLNGGPFRYGGYNAMGGGFWDGIDNVNGVLTVDPCPAISISSSSTSVCFGGSSFILASSDNPNYSYEWNPGMLSGAGQTVSPEGITTYTVSATDGVNGCVNTDEVTIFVNSFPTVLTTTAIPNSICVNGDSQLEVIGETKVKAYSFAFSTGEMLDPMTGATTILNSGNDDTPSSIQNIGFDFLFDGVLYTEYSVSPDGFIKLGAPAAVSQFTNAITSTSNIPKLYPYWDDLATGLDGNVISVVTGTAPDRILKIQWFVTIPRNISGPANSTFQAWLYETTNVVEFRYGTMNSGAMTASVGLSGNTPATNFNCVTVSTNINSTSVTNDNNAGQPENGRVYRFTPPTYAYLWAPNTYLDMDNIFNPMATNIQGAITYVVSVTDQNNCTSTDDVEITIADPVVTDSGDSGPGTLRAAIECVEEEGTITYDQPTTATTILTNPLIISKSLTIEGLSSSDKPEITVNFTTFGSNPGIKIVNGKTVILRDVDVSETNNPGTNALIEVESIDNEPTTLKVVGSTILEKP